jgi:hypothetical protein
MSNEEIKKRFTIDQLKSLEKDWQKELEFTVKDENLSSSFIEFKDTKKEELREIEEFIHVFYDWLEEKIHELEDAAVKAAQAENEKLI